MVHAVNPNYSGKYHSNHIVNMNEGIGLKINPQIRYTTDSEGASLIKELAKKADVPIQVIYFIIYYNV